MFTNIHIEKFRLCDDVLIEDTRAVVALVGRNGAGKSNILQAIAQTARLATSPDATGLAEQLRPGLRSTVELDFKAESASYRYRLAFVQVAGTTRPTPQETLSRKEGDQYVQIVYRHGSAAAITGRAEILAIGEYSPCLTAISTLLPATDQAVIDIKPARSFLSSVRYYPLNEPTEAGKEDRIVAESEYAKWVSAYESTGNSDDLLMRIIHMNQKRPDDFAAFEHFVGPKSLGLIDRIVVTKIAASQRTPTAPAEEQFYYLVRFSPGRGATAGPPLSVGYNALSLGTRRVIRLLVSMLFDASSVMLLEQPEDSLHQGLTKKVIGILRTNALPTQLIFSSHSSALLDKLLPEEVRLVSLHDGFTVVRKLTEQEIKMARGFMNEEGTLYDFIETVRED
ncbi:MAG: hypothetical protein JWN24_374 [Phycisphaerales bacterium]|nr:hypothetical protein [Phycisphaerales bacterium]